MPTASPLQDVAARITFKLVQDADGEIWQMGVGTGQRDPADVDDALTAAEDAFVSNVLPLITKCHHTATAYSEYGLTPFAGFHQVAATTVNNVSNSGAPLPPQCSLVMSLLNRDETLLPIKRRRGRIYHGMIAAAFLDGQGRIQTTDAAAIRDAWVTVDAALRTVPAANPIGSGFTIVSEAGGVMFDATSIGAGVGVDTQRRRRRKVVESIAYVDLG